MAVTTLYDWLGGSELGLLILGGERATIRHYQTAPGGRAVFGFQPVRSSLALMQVVPNTWLQRPRVRDKIRMGITVALGLPKNPWELNQ